MNRHAGLEILMERIKSRFNALICRTQIVSVNVSDSSQAAQVDGLQDELLNNVPIYQHYGFSSVPPKNSNAITIFMGAERSHGMIIATSDGTQKAVAEGDVVIYTMDGDEIKLSRGSISIKTKSISIDCPEVMVKGLLKAVSVQAENIATSSTVGIKSIVEAFNTHTHDSTTGLPTKQIQ